MIDTTKTTPIAETPVEVDAAARIFSLGVPQFKKQVEDLSLKSAKRVLRALVLFPLQNDNETILVHKDEFIIFENAMELMEAKVKMIAWTEKLREIERTKDEKQEEVKNETV